MTIRTRVLVVGGGPVGLTLGADLAWRGNEVLVVERRAEPTGHPKATLLGARSLELFRRWGLEEAIYARALPPDHPYFIVFCTRLAGHEIARFASPSTGQFRSRDPAAAARFPEMAWSPYGKTQIGQQALEPVLIDFARAQRRLDLRHGCELLGLEDRGDRIEAEIEDRATGARETVVADYLVACDGGTSRVRKALGIPLLGRGAMRANVSFFFRSPEFLSIHDKGVANLYFLFSPDSFGVFTAIDGREFWNYQHYFLDPAKETRHLDAREVLHRAVGRPFAFELLHTTHWHHHQSVAAEWRRGRVFLAGDAAHLFAPTGGVGMNTGIGDACDLAWKLDAALKGWAGPWLLDSYEAERKPVAWRNSQRSASNSDTIDLVMAETPANIEGAGAEGEAARARLAERIRWMSRQFNSAGVHLGYRYADSPICVGDGTPEPPDDFNQVVQSSWPGCRAPHVWLRDGRSTLDFFGGDFVLLALGASPEEASPLLRAADARSLPITTERIDEPAALDAYGRRFVLVRPDGHVTWRGDAMPNDCEVLIDRVRGAERPRWLPAVAETASHPAELAG